MAPPNSGPSVREIITESGRHDVMSVRRFNLAWFTHNKRLRPQSRHLWKLHTQNKPWREEWDMRWQTEAAWCKVQRCPLRIQLCEKFGVNQLTRRAKVFLCLPNEDKSWEHWQRDRSEDSSKSAQRPLLLVRRVIGIAQPAKLDISFRIRSFSRISGPEEIRELPQNRFVLSIWICYWNGFIRFGIVVHATVVRS